MNRRVRPKPASAAFPRIVIVGLPNTGKSQVFNELTGDYTLVANYPLTTVEPARRRVTLRGRTVELIDTPGLHSLYIHSEEEIAVRDLLFSEQPDGIIQCIDANRLKQSLLLTLDLLELGLPLLLCLNAIDETEARGVKIDAHKLAGLLGVRVIERAAPLNKGGEELRASLGELRPGTFRPEYGPELEGWIGRLQAALPPSTLFARATAILLLDGDRYRLHELREGLEEPGKKALDEELLRLHHAHRGGASRELAHRRTAAIEKIVAAITTREARRQGRFGLSFARACRHPLLGIPILLAIIAVTYAAVVYLAGWIQALLTRLLVDPALRAINAAVGAVFWKDLLIGDFGLLTLGLFNAFVTVLPVLTFFFLIMGLLEDIGYLPNLSVLSRRLLGAIGLSGRSVMSLILGFGCKTMATLTTRGLPSRKEKIIANVLIAFAIPCSAQLALDLAILGRVGVRAFVIAAVSLALSEIAAGFLLNRILKEDAPSEFIQELPPIRAPAARAIFTKTGYRVYWFLKEAVPIFLIASLVMFALDKSGLLGLVKQALRPVVVGWLGLPLRAVEVLMLSLARHEAAAGLILSMVSAGELSYIQSIVAVVITTMFVPCFANIVAMCRQLGLRAGLAATLGINVASFILAGTLNWILVFLKIGGL